MWQREKRRGVQVVQGCSCVNVVDEGAEKGGVAQTGAIKMQIISFRAAIFPEEAGARNPTPSPINLELIYDDGDDDDDDSVVGKRRETAFCLAADRVNTGLTLFASVSRGLFLRFEHDSRHRDIKDKTFALFSEVDGIICRTLENYCSSFIRVSSSVEVIIVNKIKIKSDSVNVTV